MAEMDTPKNPQAEPPDPRKPEHPHPRLKQKSLERIEALFTSLEWQPVEPTQVHEEQEEDDSGNHRPKFPEASGTPSQYEEFPQVEEAEIESTLFPPIPAPDFFVPPQVVRESPGEEEKPPSTPASPGAAVPFTAVDLPSFTFTSGGFLASVPQGLEELGSILPPLVIPEDEPEVVLPTSKPLTPEGIKSLVSKSLVVKDASEGTSAVLARARPLIPSASSEAQAGREAIAEMDVPTLLLEILDQNPTRLWSEDEIQLVEQVTDQLTLALENARLYQESRERARELETLNQITRAASQSLDLQQVLEDILDQVLTTFDFDAGLVSIADTTGGELKLAIQRNLPPMMVERLNAQGLKGTPCDMVYQLEELVWIPSLEQIPEEYAAWEAAFQAPRSIGCRSYAGAPLEAKGETLGTICLFNFEPRVRMASRLELLRSIGQQVGVVIDNARLFEQTQRALAETEALYQASAELQAVDNYYNILDTLRKHTILGKGAVYVSIDLYDHPWKAEQPPEWVTSLARWGTLPPEVSTERYLWQTFFSSPKLLQADRISIVHNVERDTRLDDNMRTLYGNLIQAKTLIFAPLVVAGAWIGHLSAFYRQEYTFSDEQLRHLTALAAQAAVAIQNLRLLEESRRRANQLQTAAEIARDTSSTLALESLLNRSVNLLRERFGYYHASIFLLDESGSMAIIQESTGEAGAEMKRRGHQLRVGSASVVGQATLLGEPVVVNDVSQESAKAIHQYNPLLPLTRAELGIPLKIGARVIGALDVQSTRANAFTQDDIAVLQVLADQIAVAVDNARAYEIAQKAMQEIKEADQLKSQFLANMSHELRTPLNSIIGFSRVILKEIDGPVNEMQRQDLTAIYNAGQHLLGLINDVLDLSKIEAGKMELAFEDDVDLGAMIKSVMSTVVGLVKDKPIKLQQEIQPDLPGLRVDPMKIRQVLLNLLSNAAKFTEQGAITVKARLQHGAQGDEVLVQVIDTGPGISPEDQAKLFQPFSQVDGSLTRKTGGSGLGLSISHHLIRLHGGKIGIESEIGKGSTFYFTLPVPTSDMANAAKREVFTPHREETASETDVQESNLIRLQTGELRLSPQNDPLPLSPQAPPEAMTPVTEPVGALSSDEALPELGNAPQGNPSIILAIDPDAQVLELYRRYLQNLPSPVNQMPFQIISLTDLDQAVAVAERLRPLLITLDVTMQASPHGFKDGWQVLEALKTNPSTKDIPLVVCTLNPDKARGLNLGADEYLLKPILQEDLLRAIQRLTATR